jgi:hypothetical protein
MSHMRQKYIWWVGLVVVIVELALVPPPTFAADCGVGGGAALPANTTGASRTSRDAIRSV